MVPEMGITFEHLPGKRETFMFAGIPFRVQALVNQSDRYRGLLGVRSLERNEGVLFVWPDWKIPHHPLRERRPRCFLQDMSMDIVTIFGDAGGRVVDISPALPTKSHDKIAKEFYDCPVPTRWMLEVGINSIVLPRIAVSNPFLPRRLLDAYGLSIPPQPE